MPDWIDRERDRRLAGGGHALLQSEHAAVNARYPGATWEYCSECGHPTGRAGRGEDSLFLGDDGPYCETCFEDAKDDTEER